MSTLGPCQRLDFGAPKSLAAGQPDESAVSDVERRDYGHDADEVASQRSSQMETDEPRHDLVSAEDEEVDDEDAEDEEVEMEEDEMEDEETGSGRDNGNDSDATADDEPVSFPIVCRKPNGTEIPVTNVRGMSAAVDKWLQELRKGWKRPGEKGGYKMTDDELLAKAIKTAGCVTCFGKGMNTRKALDNQENTTCKTCFNARLPCVRVDDQDRFVVVSLPTSTREGASARELGYWVWEGQGKSGRLGEKLWK